MSTLTFPDAKRGIRYLLTQFGKTYLELTADYREQGLPAFLVYRVGGSESLVFREDRISVETYADGMTAVDDASQQVHEFLLSGPHDCGEFGLIDQITTESAPVVIPQPDGFPNLVTATYRVATRGL